MRLLPRASMRPRVFPAEDSRNPARRLRLHPRFNEAAGIPRGRLGPLRELVRNVVLLQ